MRLLAYGRKKIYTKYADINISNIRDCLNEVMASFFMVRKDIVKLRKFSNGEQMLCHGNLGRDDVNIEDIDNLASYAVDFHSAHFWGNPPMFVQRGQNEAHGTDGEMDSKGISSLNEYTNNTISFQRVFANVGFDCEQVGVGYMYVNVTKPEDAKRTGRPFDAYRLDPEYSFVAYYDGIGEKKMLGVTFSGTAKGNKRITAYTETTRFDIDEKTNEITTYRNTLGFIPIVEFTRFIDRTSCFEKCISSLEAHNTKVSDFDNDYAQSVYAIWWLNDADLPKDDNGNDIMPENGQWLQTFSGEGKAPIVQALVPQIDRASVLNSIQDSRMWNLSKMYVPVSNNISGGSTGVAESMASGWEVVETVANLKEVIVKASMREAAELMLFAVEKTSTDVLPADDPIREVHISDIDFHFDRKHNYDMSTKANVAATLIKVGYDALHVTRTINLFDDPQQVVLDSPKIAEYQDSLINGKESAEEEGETVQALDAQNQNSPIIDNG